MSQRSETTNTTKKPENLHLWQHSKTKGWYIRLCIPKRLQHLHSQKVYRQSLGTKCKQEAQAIAQEILPGIKRALNLEDSVESTVHGITRAVSVVPDRSQMRYMQPDELKERFLKRLRAERSDNRANVLYDIEFFRLTDAEKRRLMDQVIDEQQPVHDAVHNAVSTEPEREPGVGIKDLLEHQEAYFLLNHATERYQGQVLSKVRDFITYCDQEGITDALELTRKHALRYRDFLLHDQQRTKENVNQRTGVLRTLWKYLIDTEVLPESQSRTFQDLNLKKSGKEKRASGRVPFTPEELTVLFEQFGPATWKTNRGALEWHYWVPRILLFTGARLAEIVNLRVHQIKEHDGVLYLDITQSKTAAGERRIPVHTCLREFFLKAQEQAQAPSEHVFPGLHYKGYREYTPARHEEFMQAYRAHTLEPIKAASNTASQWFSMQREKAGMQRQEGQKAKDTHSFRHTFTECCVKRVQADLPLVKAIVGHEDGDITSGLYGGSYELSALDAVVQQVQFDIPH